MIKTVMLSGKEVKIDSLAGQNTIIQNFGGSSVYARASPGVEAGADGVLEIPAGSAVNLYGTNGTVYLLGSGKVQLTGTDYNDLNCAVAMGASGGSGSSGGVSQAYVDARDKAILAEAKKYADDKETVLEPATNTKLGGVIVGDGLNVETDGKVSAVATETKIIEIVENQTATSKEVDDLMSLIFNT